MILLAGSSCSSDSDDTSTPATTGGDGGGSDIDPNGVIKVGFDLVQSQAGGLFLDPIKAVSSNNDGLQYLIFGRLLRPLDDGSLVPDLAESATIVDVNTIDIKLRPGATFHDGTPFDAEAVKTGLQRSLDAATSGLGQRLLSLKTIEATGTDSLTLKFPDGSAPSWYDLLGSWETTIVKSGTDFDGMPVGAGPMKVTDFKAGQSMTLAKYDEYWMADQVELAGMELVQIFVDQPQSATAALKGGQADVVNSDSTQLPSLTGDYQPFRTSSGALAIRIDFCKADGPLANPLARKAINNAIDRDAVNNGAYAGANEPAVQMFPEGDRLYNESVGDDLGYDPAAAKAALAEAGYPNGFQFTLYVPNGLGLPEVGQIMEQQLAEVGIDMTLRVANNYVEEFAGANAPGAGLAPGTSTGRQKLTSYTGEALTNTCDYNDPELTALINQLQGVNDSSDEAQVLWDKITDIIYGEALGGWVVFRTQIAGYDTTRVGDLHMWPNALPRIPLVYGTYIKANS